MTPKVLAIVNLTLDSFSDGGRWIEPSAAIARGRAAVAEGAFAVDLGAAASHPDATPVLPAEEIKRLDPVVGALREHGVEISVDSWKTETQRYCIDQGVSFLNDVKGFSDPSFYAELAEATCRLIIMHSVQESAIAERRTARSEDILSSIYRFFDERVEQLTRAGVAPDRLVLDPGMGLFLASNPEPSFAVLGEIPRLKKTFGLPVLVSVSRKSFLGSVTGRGIPDRGAATLAAEVAAAVRGVDYIRTHDVRALSDALAVLDALPDRSN